MPVGGLLVIFVCTSNTCRSPMAMKFAESWLADRNTSSSGRFISRGLTDAYEAPGSPASSNGVEVLLNDFSLDLSQHRSALLTATEVDSATLIVGVTRSHVAAVLDRFPSSKGKVFALTRDVPDPWHQPVHVYRQCAHTMKPLVYEILTEKLGASNTATTESNASCQRK